jgi:hypothetical protein
MGQCEVCGNRYELAFEVVTAGVSHTFDCFECAIHKLAPICDHCGVKVVGHGVAARDNMYCSAHCARQEGVTEVSDNAEHAVARFSGHRAEYRASEGEQGAARKPPSDEGGPRRS